MNIVSNEPIKKIYVHFKEKSEMNLATEMDSYILDNDFLKIINGNETIILPTFDIKKIIIIEE
ncbi:MAG: hypothetical protein PHP92_05010 [Candidatus Nanoarchaeia archaeon]|nr:hypothetical protein [Candidatus Nanoarchaeia archaeon]